jgi:hypothetical protein
MKTIKLLTGMLVASLLFCAGCTTPTTDPDFARARSNGHQAPVQVAADQTGVTG